MLAILAAIGATGCGPRETAVSIGNREGVLHVGNGTEPSDLDPQIVTSVTEGNIMLALFEGLVSPDPVDASPRPGVASRWETSSDGLTWTFHLRPDARWSNGDPVTAADFEWSCRRMLSPRLGSGYAYMLFILENAEAYNRAQVDDFSKVGVKALDAHTLQYRLRVPTPAFLAMLCHSSWFPVHRATIEAHGAIDARFSRWTRPGNHVGNGPFRLVEWNPNAYVRCEANPHYWNAAANGLKGVWFHVIDNPNTGERAFRSGQLHVTTTVPTQKRPALLANGDPFFHHAPLLATAFYVFNTSKPPFDDARVRRAFSMAVNREDLVRHVTGSGEIPAKGLIPPGTGGYAGVPVGIAEDPDAARRLLAEAGFPEGRGLPEIRLLVTSAEQSRILAEGIAGMWRRSLGDGIRVRIERQESKVFYRTVQNGDFMIARGGWYGDFNDPKNFIDLMRSNSGNNRTRWKSPAFDALADAADRERDPAARLDICGRAEELLMSESPIIPLYFQTSVNLRQTSVGNWHDNLLDAHPYQHVRLEP